jgi:hypothetical protein
MSNMVVVRRGSQTQEWGMMGNGKVAELGFSGRVSSNGSAYNENGGR